MTTIVYRDGIMAADTAVFDRGTYCGKATKIWRNSAGWLFGGAGALGDIAIYRDWFMAGMTGETPKFEENRSEGLAVDPEGRMFWHGTESRHVQIEGPYAAIGTGFQIALGALYMGATAEQAVEMACDLDAITRRPTTILRLKEPPDAVE